MNRKTLSTIIVTTIGVIWIGYAFSIISKSNAPIFHIISIPISKSILFVLVTLTLALILAECTVIFNRRLLFTFLSIPCILLLFNLFLMPSMYLWLEIHNATQETIRVHCFKVASHTNLSRTIKPYESGYIVLDEG